MNPATRFVLAAAIGLGAVTAHRVVAQDTSAPSADEPVSVSDLPPPTVVKGYLQLGFDRLAGFDFVIKEQPTNQKLPRWTGQDQIPDVVKNWAGKKAEIRGFMLPLRLEKGLVTEFLVMRDLSTCCYGSAPSMNHFVVVKLAKGVPSVSEKIVKVSGTFQINTSFDAFGIMTGIYQMAGEKVVEVGE
ncbi:MAG: hypothetical protein RL324_877 [Verrucomicrobiota bacterium]|jgi:hypothetical protein